MPNRLAIARAAYAAFKEHESEVIEWCEHPQYEHDPIEDDVFENERDRLIAELAAAEKEALEKANFTKN